MTVSFLHLVISLDIISWNDDPHIADLDLNDHWRIVIEVGHLLVGLSVAAIIGVPEVLNDIN